MAGNNPEGKPGYSPAVIRGVDSPVVKIPVKVLPTPKDGIDGISDRLRKDINQAAGASVAKSLVRMCEEVAGGCGCLTCLADIRHRQKYDNLPSVSRDEARQFLEAVKNGNILFLDTHSPIPQIEEEPIRTHPGRVLPFERLPGERDMM